MKAALGAGLAVALLLGGCISLLPKTPPAQLYSFGDLSAPAAARQTPERPRAAVQMLSLDFQHASAGDLMLTMTGAEAAYIKGSRWVSGAQSLFEQALAHAFDDDAGPARLMALGEAVRPDYFLKLDVRTFQASYLEGQGAAPTVRVELYAALSRPADRTLTGERIFSASVPASENRIGAIVTAYDKAVTQVLGALAKWVDTEVQSPPAASPA